MSIKVGVIGAGGMLKYHAEGFRAAGAEIVAVADPAPGAADRAAKTWNIAKAYDSVDKMLAESPELDAISIIVPNKFHAPLALQGLKAGKHVFCEKPPALSAAEVKELIDASEAAGKKLMFNFNNRRSIVKTAPSARSIRRRRNGSAAPAFPASAVGSPPRNFPAAARSSTCCT
jgi:predicted dehydrogenase